MAAKNSSFLTLLKQVGQLTQTLPGEKAGEIPKERDSLAMLPARCRKINLAMLLVPPPGSEMRDGIVSRRTWEEKVKSMRMITTTTMMV